MRQPGRAEPARQRRRVRRALCPRARRQLRTPCDQTLRGRDRMTCDKTDLCRLSTATGSKLTAGRAATPDDEFFRLALSNPVLRQALGQVYRDYYQ